MKLLPHRPVEMGNPNGHPTKEYDPTKLKICVDFRELNKVTLTNPFPTPYADEILNEVPRHECYSFTDRFLGYNQVPIAKEDKKRRHSHVNSAHLPTKLCLLV